MQRGAIAERFGQESGGSADVGFFIDANDDVGVVFAGRSWS